MVNSLSRFQLIQGNQMLMPGKCASCGTVTGTFIDFGFDLDHYGCVYLCAVCIGDAASQLDYIKEASYTELAKEFVNLDDAYVKVRVENDELRAALNIAKRAADDTANPLAVFIKEVVEESAVGGDTGESSEDGNTVTQTAESEVTGSEPGPIKPVNESRSKRVRNDDRLEGIDALI